jgi:hypothetical protein
MVAPHEKAACKAETEKLCNTLKQQLQTVLCNSERNACAQGVSDRTKELANAEPAHATNSYSQRGKEGSAYDAPYTLTSFRKLL